MFYQPVQANAKGDADVYIDVIRSDRAVDIL